MSGLPPIWESANWCWWYRGCTKSTDCSNGEFSLRRTLHSFSKMNGSGNEKKVGPQVQINTFHTEIFRAVLHVQYVCKLIC